MVDRAFDRTMAPLRADPSPLTVLFSGGVDSSSLGHALRGHPDLELLTVGVEGSPDLANGRSAARQLDLPWRGVAVGPPDLWAVGARCGDLVEAAPGTARSVAVSLAVALARTRPSRVVTAQGVDELFLGYAHFRGLEGEALNDRYRADLSLLLDREWPRAQRLAARLDRPLLAPFIEPELLAAVRTIPLAVRADAVEPKAWFRAWAIHRGLPSEIAHRPKKALQYGTGIDRLLKGYGLFRRAGPGADDPALARSH